MAFTLTETPDQLPEELRTRLDATLGSTEIHFLSEAGSREQLLDSLQTAVVGGSTLNLDPEDIESLLQDARRLLVIDLVGESQPLTQLTTEAVDLLKAEANAACQRDLLICLQASEELELKTLNDCIQAIEPLAQEDSTVIFAEMGVAPANRVLLIMACQSASLRH